MLTWESFDNLEKQRQDAIRRQADELKQRQYELENAKEEAKKIAYAEALDKATEDFQLKKENAVNELTAENAQQIKKVHNIIEKSVREQSLHYAKLLTGIIQHFIPKLCEHKTFDRVSETLSLILEGCDQRKLIVVAHTKTLEKFTQLIACETRRIELVEKNDLKEGLIQVSYEGGGAEMDMTQYQGQAIACLNEMLGFEISDKPMIENIDTAEVPVFHDSQADIDDIDALLDEVMAPAEDMPEAQQDGNNIPEEAKTLQEPQNKKPLFQDFGEEAENVISSHKSDEEE